MSKLAFHTISEVPGTVSAVIADVVRSMVLANSARAAARMATVSPIPVDSESVTDVLTSFADDLDTV